MASAANRTSSPAPGKGALANSPVSPRRAAAAITVEDTSPKSMGAILQVYWTLIFAALVVAMQALVEPKQDWVWPPELDLTFKQAKSVLTSPWVWVCWAPMLLGVVWLRSFFKKHKLALVEQSMMMWWWTNIFFFHTHCDMMSGFYQVMPGLTQIYAEMTLAHKQPRWADARLHLDATYFLELTVEIPLAIFMIFLYVRRDPARVFVECFAVAVQLAGTVTYYAPALLRGEESANWVSWNDRIFGAVWIVVPLLVLRRHFLFAREGHVVLDRAYRAGQNKKD